jgi:hypothetical protein
MVAAAYEVKRLEYQLRVDAAKHCPGTRNPAPVSPEEDDQSPGMTRQSILRRIAAATATMTTHRIRLRPSPSSR